MERMVNRYSLGEEVIHSITDSKVMSSIIKIIDIGMKDGFTNPEVRYNKRFYEDDIICLSSRFNKIYQ